ncbi:MAG: LamG-like jellyroll fold domain-containing protein, partial [Phycisphaerae bacterium]
MCKKLIYLVSIVLVLGLVLTGVAKAADPDLIGCWRFDEGSGTTAFDSSGNGNDGIIEGDALWVPGKFGGALEFNGQNARVVAPHIPLDSRSFTITMWVYPVLYTGEQVVISQVQSNSTNTSLHYRIYGPGSGRVRMGFYSNDLDTTTTLDENNWYHITFWYDFENQNRRIYINGVLEAEASATPYLGTSGDTVIGMWDNTAQWFRGIIDDVRIYARPLTDAEILGVMSGGGAEYPFASAPDPADGVYHLDTWVNLSWRAGDFAVSHDVYFGENFDDVNDGAESVFQGSQSATYFVAGFPGFLYPDGLIPGTTYHWRIDEVNDTEPNSPWKGNVWSFTVPPRTAYAPDPADGDESVDPDARLSWTAGFGAKLHTVYFGENFDDVSSATGGLPQGATTYDPGTLKLAQTYYWRVDEFDAIQTHKGDVWSFTTQGAVGSPNPANGAVDVKQTQIITFSPSIFAASHQLYFGTDKDAVKNADTSSPEYKGTRDLGAE